MASLNGKVALVFGAGSASPGWSNGRAAAVAYARAGARVVAVDIGLQKAQETQAIIESEQGKCLALEADVVVAADVKRVVERTLAEFGAVDVLHNNVGIPGVAERTHLDEEHWAKILDSNLKSVFLTCGAVLPFMQERRQGVITNISSIAAIQVNRPNIDAAASTSRSPGLPSIVAYGAAKAGLNQFSRTIAVTYAAFGIRCNVILPGNIDTPRIRGYSHMVKHFGGEEQMLKARHAMSLTGKMGTAWDIAHASVFLAGDEASYINGVLLPVDGGMSCT